MPWEETEATMKQTAAAIAKALEGKTIAKVTMSVDYPGVFSHVEILTNEGERLTISELTSGCAECNPEGMPDGISVDFGSRT